MHNKATIVRCFTDKADTQLSCGECWKEAFADLVLKLLRLKYTHQSLPVFFTEHNLCLRKRSDVSSQTLAGFKLEPVHQSRTPSTKQKGSIHLLRTRCKL